MTRTHSTIATVALLGFLAACGSGPQTAGIDRGGVAAPVAIEGPITGFGSIYVNGIRFDIASAQITANGVVVTQADLAIGQVVNVVGTLDPDGVDGTADAVVFEAHVLGPVTALDTAAGTLTVLGQTVQTDAETVIEADDAPVSLAVLVVGDVVEISGYVGAGGTIVATRVEREDGDEYRVRGRATNVDTAARTLMINGLALDYGAAFLVENFPSGQPQAGDEVIAVGSALGPSGELLVEQLRLRAQYYDGQRGEENEIEGLITRFVSPTDFDVAGQRVTTTASTEYEGGDAGDLALNVKIQVEGERDDAGVVVADKVEVKDGGRVY
jgi:Domain of unknown function (DUF5666)